MDAWKTMDMSWAAEIAREHLAMLRDRWRHTQSVGETALRIAGAVPEEDRSVLISAAWLHDLGYGPAVRQTGFHPLDGARYLTELGIDGRLCALVAHHSGAEYEATERGLLDELMEYPREDGPVLDALVYADMTTGPQGQTVAFEDRIAEILQRYSPDDPVHRAISASRLYLDGAVERTRSRLGETASRDTV